MRRMLLGVILTVVIGVGAAIADQPAFTLDGRLTACFPDAPAFTAEVPLGPNRIRGYHYNDESSGISYSATLMNGPALAYTAADADQGIADQIRGNALSVHGTVRSKKIGTWGGDPAATYVIQYSLRGQSVEKHSIVVYHQGLFFSWSVSEILGYSGGSAAQIFSDELRCVKVK